jgi:hypothetical protein
MKALNSAIGSFQRVCERTSCPLIRSVGAGLLDLAYGHSGRANRIADDLRAQYQNTGINPDNFSPWEGDYGNFLASTRTMETNSGAA